MLSASLNKTFPFFLPSSICVTLLFFLVRWVFVFFWFFVVVLVVIYLNLCGRTVMLIVPCNSIEITNDRLLTKTLFYGHI